MLPVVKGGHQHQKRAFGEMEIGNQGVHRFEAVAGVYENTRVARHGVHHSLLVRRTLNRPAGGCPHADQPAAVLLATVSD